MNKKNILEVDTNGFNLGEEVIDPITGFTGVIVGITQWFSGCAVASVQPKMKEDGTIPDFRGYDVTRLKKIATTRFAPSQQETGGPQPEPRIDR